MAWKKMNSLNKPASSLDKWMQFVYFLLFSLDNAIQKHVTFNLCPLADNLV